MFSVQAQLLTADSIKGLGAILYSELLFVLSVSLATATHLVLEFDFRKRLRATRANQLTRIFAIEILQFRVFAYIYVDESL